jgi:murein DD-endopeptidase MepM/ murein hydrolase activator NlpD
VAAETQYNRISSDYGYRGSEFHLGIDIPAAYGSNVYAANGGKVIKATYHYSYGNYILIDHGGGQATLYAHNSKLLVSEGDTVSKGDVIALAGSTGASTGNHIHFEVRINGVTTDPKKYVS